MGPDNFDSSGCIALAWGVGEEGHTGGSALRLADVAVCREVAHDAKAEGDGRLGAKNSERISESSEDDEEFVGAGRK